MLLLGSKDICGSQFGDKPRPSAEASCCCDKESWIKFICEYLKIEKKINRRLQTHKAMVINFKMA